MSQADIMQGMQIFISWSGAKARAAAYLLRNWLPSVIQSLDTPWVSDVDIESGANWSASIGDHLATAQFGIVCVTRENQDRPWLNFEAGAISKLVGGAVPLLIDFDSAGDLSGGPMSQLQVRMPDVAGITKLMQDINRRLDKPLDAAVLDLALKRSFGELEAKLAEISNDPSYATPEHGKRSLDEKVDELLRLARSNTTARPRNIDYPRANTIEAVQTQRRLMPRMFSVRLRPEEQELLERLATRSDSTPSAILRSLVSQQVQQEWMRSALEEETVTEGGPSDQTE